MRKAEFTSNLVVERDIEECDDCEVSYLARECAGHLVPIHAITNQLRQLSDLIGNRSVDIRACEI